MKSVGITGQMTGSRAHLMIFDDVEVPANSATDMQREKLLQLVTESESILTPDEDFPNTVPWDSAVNFHNLSKAG